MISFHDREEYLEGKPLTRRKIPGLNKEDHLHMKSVSEAKSKELMTMTSPKDELEQASDINVKPIPIELEKIDGPVQTQQAINAIPVIVVQAPEQKQQSQPANNSYAYNSNIQDYAY